MNEKQLREAIKELTAELDEAALRRDWDECFGIDLDLEDLTKELNLLTRSEHYSIRKG